MKLDLTQWKHSPESLELVLYGGHSICQGTPSPAVASSSLLRSKKSVHEAEQI